MELKPGYKQTEVGVIPANWTVRRFGDVAAPRKERIDPSDAGTQEFCVELEHIEPGSGRLMDSTSTGKHSSLKTVFCAGDVLFGKLRAYLRKYWLADRRGVCSTELWALAGNPNVLASPYLLHIVTTEMFVEAANNAYGTHMPRSDWGVVKNLKVPVPPLPEQRAIAAALSDTDAFLTAQDWLIIKKRDLRHAAMQQLLTGKQRLPGFHGEWEVKTYDQLFRFLKTANNPWADLSASGEVGYIHYGDIHTRTSAFLNCADVVLPRLSERQVGDTPLLEDGDLVMVDASEDYAGIGRCVEIQHTGDNKIIAGLHTFLLRGDKGLLADGFKGYLQFIPSVKALLVRLATGISVYGISKNNVKKSEVLLPQVDEQTAIAAVLSDMDAELAALEQQRDKTRAIKQGMLQELLTGKVRLA